MTGPVTPAPLLTINDLARLLGLSRKAVYGRRHRRGALPRAVVVGRSLRWRPEDVEQWLAQQTETAPDH